MKIFLSKEFLKNSSNIRSSKPNKKGVFYSISVLMFILFLLIYFNAKADVQKKEDEFHVERVQLIVMNHFVNDFEDYYIHEILSTAAKPAFIELTNSISSSGFTSFTKENVVDLMKDGVNGSVIMNPLLATNDNFKQALGTLTFNPESVLFDYSLDSVEQPSYDTIRLNFLVNYSFSFFDAKWSRKNLPVSINISIYSLFHPLYNKVIETNWVENTAGCYINSIITPPQSCDGMNIMPPCGNGVIDEGELCDGTNFGGMTCTNYGFTSGSLHCIKCQEISTENCFSNTQPQP